MILIIDDDNRFIVIKDELDEVEFKFLLRYIELKNDITHIAIALE
jgi:hypothetical protein